MRKILQIHIKALDEKNHVRIYSLSDIDPTSIVFLADKKVKAIPKDIPKKEEPQVESKKKDPKKTKN